MSDNSDDTATSDETSAPRAPRFKPGTGRTIYVGLRRLALIVVTMAALVILGAHDKASATEVSDSGSQSVSEGTTAPVLPPSMVIVVLPETTGDNVMADLVTEVYALRLQRAGFVAFIGDACSCMYGDAQVATQVRDEIEYEYPGVWGAAFQS